MIESKELVPKMFPIGDFASYELKHNKTVEFAVKKFLRNMPELLLKEIRLEVWTINNDQFVNTDHFD